MGEKGKVTGLKTVQVEFKDGKFVEVPGTEKVFKGRPGAAGHGLCGARWRRCSTPLAWKGRPRQRPRHDRL